MKWQKKELWLVAAPLLVIAVLCAVLYIRDTGKAVFSKAAVIPRETLQQNGLVYFSLCSPNGKVIATGEVIGDSNWYRKRQRPITADMPVSAFPPHVYLWDAQSGKLKHRLKGNLFGGWSNIMRPLAFSRDSRFLYTKCTRGIEKWDVNSGSVVETKPRNDYSHLPEGSLTEQILRAEAANSPDRTKIVSVYLGKEYIDGYRQRKVLMSDHHTGKRLWSVTVKYVDAVAFSPNGRTVAAVSHFQQWYSQWGVNQGPLGYTARGHIMLFNAQTGRLLWEKANTEPLQAVSFSPDGQMLAVECGSIEYKTLLLSTAHGDIVKTIERGKAGRYGDALPALAFLPDGKTLLTQDDKNVQLWDISNIK